MFIVIEVLTESLTSYAKNTELSLLFFVYAQMPRYTSLGKIDKH